MSADTATAPVDGAPRTRGRILRRRVGGIGGSRLGRLILGLNLLGLAILVIGALVLNEFSRGLVQARVDSLSTQADLLSYVIVQAATEGDPTPSMNGEEAREILELLAIPRSERARLYDAQGKLIADTDVIADKVIERPLPPAQPRGPHIVWPWSEASRAAEHEARAHVAERAEVNRALGGYHVAHVRTAEAGGRVVSVSIPIQRVRAVLGVLTIEAGDVDKIVAEQRLALIPFILIALAAVLASSILLNGLVAEPVRRLARAADSVRLSRARAISLPDIAERQDEVGDLARSLDAMTSTLTTRMDAIERFAADVSHEIKNPLTSMRSALETMALLPPGPGRERMAALLQADVKRIDRLITDIANASRLDAELSRDNPRPLDLARFLTDIAAPYEARAGDRDVAVSLLAGDAAGPFLVAAREGPLGQVFRNLVDNARSFSPAGGAVRLRLRRGQRGQRAFVAVDIDDDGPGVPEENLEGIFSRFYTNRPKGAGPGGSAFGGHSGLGLSIVRQIVEAHGGRAFAVNRKAADGAVTGARFTVELPAAEGWSNALRQPVHATLVAARREGFWQGALLRGPCGSGKSDLALRALAAGWALVGDDRVQLWTSGEIVYGAAPPRLSGLVEARGLGVIGRPALRFARVRLVVDAQAAEDERIPEPAWSVIEGSSLPCFRLSFVQPGSVVRLALALDAAMRRRARL